MLIGLSGYARSGKDSVANILVKNYGYERRAFADKLRDVLYKLNPIVSPSDRRLQDVIDELGWEGSKKSEYNDEIRTLLQRLGTEAGRQTLWDSIWVDAAMHDVGPKDKIAFADVRFPNEADAVRDAGGIVVRVERPGIEAANTHASETSLDNYYFDHYLPNDGTLRDLEDRVEELLYGDL